MPGVRQRRRQHAARVIRSLAGSRRPARGGSASPGVPFPLATRRTTRRHRSPPAAHRSNVSMKWGNTMVRVLRWVEGLRMGISECNTKNAIWMLESRIAGYFCGGKSRVTRSIQPPDSTPCPPTICDVYSMMKARPLSGSTPRPRAAPSRRHDRSPDRGPSPPPSTSSPARESRPLRGSGRRGTPLPSRPRGRGCVPRGRSRRATRRP